MLVATPFLGFESHKNVSGTPRIISEIRKREPITPLPQIRPRISGDLLVICANEARWWPRRVAVRSGQLHVSSAPGEASPTNLRLPLRHLSLKAGPLPNSLALCKGQHVLLTLQTASQRAFDLWAKTIAIELIRQTPLDSVKYLDILALTDSKYNEKNPVSCDLFQAKASAIYDINGNIKQGGGDTVDARVLPVVEDEKTVEVLLKKCQNSETYVPVREKLVLFESLCKLGRKVKSSEDVSLTVRDVEAKKIRARSLHDLSNCSNSHVAVREICKYFEKKSDEMDSNTVINKGNKRLISSDSQLNIKKKFQS